MQAHASHTVFDQGQLRTRAALLIFSTPSSAITATLPVLIEGASPCRSPAKRRLRRLAVQDARALALAICAQDPASRGTRYTPPHPRLRRQSTRSSAWCRALPTATSRVSREIACSRQSTRMEEPGERLRAAWARPDDRRSRREVRIACRARCLVRVPKNSRRQALPRRGSPNEDSGLLYASS